MFKSVVRRFAFLAVFTAFVFALMGGLATKTASADPACTNYVPPFQICVAYEQIPNGGTACTSSTPASNEVLVYSAINYGGQCSRVAVGVSVSDFGSNGWKNSIRSMKVGSAAHAYGCNANQFNWGNGWGCSIMGSPYGQNFPNTAGSQNWGSFEAY